MTVPTRVLVVCDGAAVPSRLAALEWPEKQIRSRGLGADLDLHLQSLGAVLRKQIAPRSADLVRIASYAYRADTMVSRGGERDAHNSKWKRNFALCVPVADPEYWSAASVQERLTAVLGFATGDSWEFAFNRGDDELSQLPLDVQQQAVLGQPQVVTLLSGGVDSLCALLEAAANGERPVAVGHWSAPAHETRQKTLLGEASRRLSAWNFPHLGFRIHRQGVAWADNSQRSRAFLFASLGAAVAGEIGVGRVYLPDNGPISLNLPINDQLVGTLASRTTHPKFLHLFNRFIDGLFPAPVVVSNPLAARTRAEAMGVLKTTRCEPLLSMTLSCSSWQRLPAKTPQCGVCSQCVDRRFAVIAADLETYDPADHYRSDVFVDDLDRWQARTTAESYVRFAQRVLPMDNDQLFLAFPQLRDAVVPGDPSPEASMLGAMDVVKRHALMVRSALKTMVHRHLDSYLDGILPSSCLLSIAPVGFTDQGASVGSRQPATGEAVPAQEESGTNGMEPTNVFALVGDRWVLSYGGTIQYLHPVKGLAVIALLLAHPERPFTASEIEARLEPPGEAMSDDASEHEELRPDRWGAGGTIADRQAVKEYRQALADLDEDIEAAERDHDFERAGMLKEQKDFYLQQVRAAVSPGGRLKSFSDDLSKQKARVSRNLRRAIDAVTRKHPELGMHLDRSILRSTDFSYRPESEMHWRFVPPAS